MTDRPSRAFWVIPCQPVQELLGAQGDAPDPVGAMVLMGLIAGMSLTDGYNDLPAFHISISQRELAQRLKLSRKVVCNALERLEKGGHCTPIKVPSDGQRKGPNARILYRIDLLADEATAFHGEGPSKEPSTGPQGAKKGPLYIQTEISDREQITTKSDSNGISPDVEHVAGYYLKTHPRRKVGEKERKVIKRALKTFTAEELCEAIRGNAADPWHKEKRKHEIGYVLRDADHVSQFRDVAARDNETTIGHDDDDFFTAGQ